MRQPLRINELAWKSNLSGFEIFSMYKSLTWESFSASNFSSIYCNTSSMPICLPFPIDQTEWNGNPLITADSRINTAVAPEPDIKSTPLGLSCGIGCVNTLWCHAFNNPIQLGPIKAQPYFSQESRIRFSSSAPAFVSSPNPAEMMINALTFFSLAKYST